MGKLLIGCYSYHSPSCYGQDSTNVTNWLKNAVKEFYGTLQLNLGKLEQGNAFYGIFASPEYQFTDPTSPASRHAMDEKTKDAVMQELKEISKAYKKVLIFPGTIFWKQSLEDEESRKKAQANLIAAQLNLRFAGGAKGASWARKPDAVGGLEKVMANTGWKTDGDAGKQIPSLKSIGGALTPKSKGFRALNELYPFLDGEARKPYLKSWDFKETEGATVTDQAFIPGSSSATIDIGGFEFGMEICFDHANGNLKSKGKEVDFHIVVSDYVETKEGNMQMKDGGYFIHASSNWNETGVYQRAGANKTKLPSTPPDAKAYGLNYWLVNIEKRASA